MASLSDESAKSSSPVDKDFHKSNGLLLYFYKYSFYSQKVIMALYEKKLAFKTQTVDIRNGEQFQPWFIELNPLCQVPVLKDGVKIIPDSSRIIDYLEDNLSNGAPRLVPHDQGAEIRLKVVHYRNLLDEIPIGLLTKGSFFFPEFVKDPLPPFSGGAGIKFQDSELGKSDKLREIAKLELDDHVKQILLGRAASQDEQIAQFTDKQSYVNVLDDVDLVLTEMEKELASHEEMDDWWLCTDRFTLADINLSVLLDRLNNLGLSHRFWGEGKRPLLESYFSRIKQRESYKNTIPSSQTKSLVDFNSGVLLSSVVFLVVVTFFIYFKRKSK